MNRKLNVKLLLILIVTVSLGAFGVHRLHDYQVHRSIGTYLTRAGNSEKAGDRTKAIRSYRVYLTLQPNDLDVQERFGRLLCADESIADSRELENAAYLFESVLAKDAKRDGLRRRLVKLYMTIGRYPDARDHLKILLEAGPRDAEIHFLLGRCHESLAKYMDAAEEYEKTIRDDPTQIDAYGRLARLNRLQFRAAEKADDLMDARKPSRGVVEANPRHAKAYLARGIYRREFGIPGFEEDSREALELDPDDIDVRILAADVAIAARPTPRLDEARLHLEHALAKHPKDVRLYGAVSDVELRAKRPEIAIARLEAGLKQLPDANFLRWSLADLLIQAGRTEQIDELIAELKARGMDYELVDYLQGQLSFRAGRWTDAVKIFESVGQLLGVRPERQELSKFAYITLGECYERLGNTDQRYEAYRRAVGITPARDRLAVAARAGLAASLVALGRLDTAIDEYRKNLILPDAPDSVKIVLARLLIFRNLRLPESSRRWEEVEALLEASAVASPDSVDVSVLRAETLSARKQLEPARKLLETALEKHPNDVDIWVALSVIAVRQERSEDALKILDDAEKKLGDQLEIRLARARFWAGRGGADASVALAKLTSNTSKFSAIERVQLYNGVADGYLRIGDITSAAALWSTLAKEQPNNLQIRLILFDSAILTGNVEGMETALQEIRRIEGEEGTLWRYARARILLQNAKERNDPAYVEARSMLQSIVLRRPAWPRAPLSLAEIDDRQDNPEAALKGYERALRLGDRSPLAIRRTVQLYYQFRRYTQADQVLRMLQEEMPISTEMQKLAADVSLQTRDYNRALELARRAISVQSSDYHDHIWLGQLLWTVSRKDETDGRSDESKSKRVEAEQSLRRAVELAAPQPETWIALIQFLSNTNNLPAAEKAILDAEKVIPREKSSLALGQANELIGRTDRALTLYKRALEEQPSDPPTIQALASFYIKSNRIQDAKPLLDRLIELRAPDAPWARRILAIALSMEGREREAIQALSFLNLPDDTDTSGLNDASIDDLRAKAQVYAQQLNRDRRREAIRILESIGRRERNRIDDLLLLGRLYEMDGNWNKAREQYQTILSVDPVNSLALAAYSRDMIRRKSVVDARPWVAKLAKTDPTSPAAAELQARLAVLDNQPDKAVTILRDLVQKNPAQLGIVASLLEDLRLYPAAEEMFRRIADEPGQPANGLVLAEYLGRRGRTSEALDLCDKAWSNVPPARVALTSVQVLFASEIGMPDCNRVADRFEAAIKAAPTDPTLTFYLANVRILQGRYAEAESVFREAFERNKSSSSPLNNLAWLLSLQDGKGSQALEAVNQAITIGGAVPHYLDTRAMIHLSMGRFDLAIKELEDAVAVAPSPANNFHLAQAYAAGKREIDAADALQEAHNLGLKPSKLHPFERKAYERLVSTLPKKQ